MVEANPVGPKTFDQSKEEIVRLFTTDEPLQAFEALKALGKFQKYDVPY